jgi:hypothetical protein
MAREDLRRQPADAEYCVVCVTIPDMLKRPQSIAKKEIRTMSELIRENVRYYERAPGGPSLRNQRGSGSFWARD